MLWRGVILLGGEAGWSSLPAQAQAARVAWVLAEVHHLHALQPVAAAALIIQDGRVWLVMTTEGKL